MNFSISVVIPNYNGQSLLAQVLPSVYNALSTINNSYEVIVVDDCSTDNSIAFIETHFQEVKIICNSHNLGFSNTVNKGIFAAQNDLLLILNNDVKLLPHYFEHQFHFFTMPDTFGVNATIYDWDSDVLQGGGKIINRQLFKIKANKNFYLQANSSQTDCLTMFLSGTNALIDRKKLLLLNGFDNLFNPFYVEDVELSIRALRMGWKMYYAPQAACMHQISVTIKQYNKKQKIKFLTLRNKFYLHYIHLNGLQLAAWYLQTVIEICLRSLTLNLVYLKAFSTFLKNKRGRSLSKQTFTQLLVQNNRPKNGLFTQIKLYKKELFKRLDS